jgi:transcriptional regulator GlxA family with amidase domain
MHRVAVVAVEGLVAFDLATPTEAFARIELRDGTRPYRVRVCSERRKLRTEAFDIVTRHDLGELSRADTVIVPGMNDPRVAVSSELVNALQRAHRRGARIASICTGAFVLAAAGLLDGLRATTHWLACAQLAARYPSVSVDASVLYVDNGQILTSAGAAAGLDLCLHLVRKDFGASVAAHAARIAVMPLERAGGQAQFIVHAPPVEDGASLEPVLAWLSRSVHEQVSLTELARRAGLSVRTLNRRFREQTGSTPHQWLLRARVQRAQELLEHSELPVERIAEQVGFASATPLREHFQRIVSTSPQAYRRSFRALALGERKLATKRATRPRASSRR